MLVQKVLIRTEAAHSAELIETLRPFPKTLPVFQLVKAHSRVHSVYVLAYSSFNISMNYLVQMINPFVYFGHFLLKTVDAVPKY